MLDMIINEISNIMYSYLLIILLLAVPMRLIQHFMIDRNGSDYHDDQNG